MKQQLWHCSFDRMIGLCLICVAGILNGQSLRPDNARLVIRSGFEPDVSFSGKLHGVDHSVPGPNNDWDDLRDIFFSTLFQKTAEIAIVSDPENDTNRVMLYEILTPGEKKGRAQGSFVCKEPERYDAFFYRFRWYIPDDWKSLKDLNPHGWTDFWEIWTQAIPESECDAYDGAGSFRINFSFYESATRSNTFHWHAGGHNRSYYNEVGPQRWDRYNDSVPVPFGAWSTVEVFLQKGPDPKMYPESRSRFVFRIKPDGGRWQTVFDIRDERTEHSHRPQPGYKRCAPFKNYTRRNNIDYLLSKGLRVYFLYDDIELWAGEASDSISFPVNNPPRLHFTQPADTMRLIAPVDLGVVVEASDRDGTIDNVTLHLDDNLIRRENVTPYTWGTAAPVTDSALLGLTAGTYTLRAEATDNGGATTSVSKSVTVEPGAVRAVTGMRPILAVMNREECGLQLFDPTGKLLHAEDTGHGNAASRSDHTGLSGVVIRRITGGDARVTQEVIIR